MARGYRRKRYYSTLQRILTHLSSGPREPTSLGAYTQEGIAAATYYGRTTATKWLARMESRGLVTGEREHVPAHRVRKTVYRLTHDGWVDASRLRTRFATDIVDVVAPDIDPTPMRVSEIPDLFPAYVNLTATVSLVKGGRLDLTKVPGIGSGAIAPVLWGDTVRRLGRVFGRAEEFRSLDAWAGSASPALVVTGIAGVGKSTLVASWLVRQRPRPYIYWFEIHEGTTRAVFLRDFAAFLTRIGRRGLATILAERRAEAPAVTVRVLEHELQDAALIIVLDNFDQAPKDLGRFLTDPVLDICQSTASKLLLISRTVPGSLARRKGTRAEKIEILRVDGLDREASLSLLRAKGFAGNETALEAAASSARGHPILLSFAAQTGSSVSGEITRYLEREIWRTLSRPERTVLEAACLFRGLVPLDSLHCFSPDWQTALHGLQAKNLFAPTISAGVVVHNSVRDYIRDRLPEGRRRQFHGLAATYFLDGMESRDRLEGMYHLIEAGDMKSFGAYLSTSGMELLDSTPASELLAVLRKVDRASLDSLASCIFPELMGDTLRAVGDLQPALLEYRHALQRSETEKHPERTPGLLRKVATIERCRNEPAKALGHLVEAQARLKEHPDLATTGEVLREMGLLEKTRGRLEEAARRLSEAVDIATEVSEPGALARSLSALGTIERTRGNLEQSLQYKLESLRIAERGANLTETARSSVAVGVSLHELSRHEESLKYYDRSLQLARLVGNIRLQGYSMMNRAAAMMDLGLYQDAGPVIEEAKRLIQILEERDTLALVDISEGQREMGLGRWNRATRLWERGLATLKDFGDVTDYARALMYVGKFHLEKGEVRPGQRFLDEAAAIARELGDRSLTASIEALWEPSEPSHTDSRP